MVDCRRVQSGSPRQKKLSRTPTDKTYDHLLYVHPSNSKNISTVNPCVRQGPCPPKTSYLTRKNQYGPLDHLLEDWYWNGSHILPMLWGDEGPLTSYLLIFMSTTKPLIHAQPCLEIWQLWQRLSQCQRSCDFHGENDATNLMMINTLGGLLYLGDQCNTVPIFCRRTLWHWIYILWENPFKMHLILDGNLRHIVFQHGNFPYLLNISTSADYTIRYCIYSSIFTKRQVTPLLPSNSSYSIYHFF